MNTPVSAPTVAAFGLVLAAALPGAAQETPDTFRACYVPQVGAMYLLDLPGLPTRCLSSDHREITWTEGQAPGENSVGAAQLQEGAVTGDKLADGAVSAPKLAPAAVTADAIAPDAVGSEQIAFDAVGSAEIGVNAVGNLELAPLAVTTQNISLNAVTSTRIAPGAVGSEELAPNGVGGRELNLGIEFGLREVTIDPGVSSTYLQRCPDGLEILTGGFSGAGDGLIIRANVPIEEFRNIPTQAWLVSAENKGTSARSLRVTAVCADLR